MLVGEAREKRRDGRHAGELAETESTWVKVPDLDKTQLLPVAHIYQEELPNLNKMEQTWKWTFFKP